MEIAKLIAADDTAAAQQNDQAHFVDVVARIEPTRPLRPRGNVESIGISRLYIRTFQISI